MISTTPPSEAGRSARRIRTWRSRGKYVDSGQLQRLRDLRHLQSREAGAGADLPVPGVAERRVGLQEPAVHVVRGDQQPQDCGFGGVPEPVSKTRVRGIRIFDISDVKHPKLVTSVQTCRGSHTHTVVTQPGDDDNVYIYVSGTAGVRSAEELPGCADGGIDDPNTARFRLEVIKVPLREAERGGDRQFAAHLQRSAGAAAQ